MTVFIKEKDFDNIKKMIDWYRLERKIYKKKANQYWCHPFYQSFLWFKVSEAMQLIFGDKLT